MRAYQKLNYSTWKCKYDVVFIPKYRRKALFKELRHHWGQVFRTLTEQKESQVEEGHVMPDHVHMLLSIPPKYAVAQAVGYMKGKSAIHIARTFGERKRNFVRQHFWARDYFVSTVGRAEVAIREYIQNQEQEDCSVDQLRLILRHGPLLSNPVGDAKLVKQLQLGRFRRFESVGDTKRADGLLRKQGTREFREG